ncbi:flagellar hook-associated protein FlgK [Novosphingobium sp. FSY-8]|uniref:Flagellar hook-associated protein 1 n=1 Tax=Novosphingobium ovatum TaxID=1908523 RepID=A0ABW9XG55_9SPHN|nr:flagellar hook-associated protein FlgK [Novosphingobium ovatum]NBC37501.1 flagellar hook-associated protein FlgK [Novosphingobium ovatum]
MSTDMITIAASGTRAARAMLDVTAQNIANANTTGYVRRSVNLSELSSTGMGASFGEVSQYGVRVTGITRNVSAFLQSEVRRTGSDSARADTLVSGLTNVSDALDQSNVYNSISSFMAAAQKLTANPTDSSLRANLLESARTMAQSFNTASKSLDAATQGLQFSADGNVTSLNDLAQSLAVLNTRIRADNDPQSNHATLLDERDKILQQMSEYADITTTVASDNTVQVQIGGATGQMLVDNNGANTVSMATAADGTITYALGGKTLTLSGGSLAGQQQALTTAASARAKLDTIADTLMETVNDQQAAGVDLNGNTPAAAMFSGSGAGGMTIAMTSGDSIATAPNTALAGSKDVSNLTALQSALSDANIAGDTNDLLFSLSAAVASNTTTRDALSSIASNAKAALSEEAGVDLDTEAANLVRYQQAFQASGKVIQIASSLFDQLLNL